MPAEAQSTEKISVKLLSKELQDKLKKEAEENWELKRNISNALDDRFQSLTQVAKPNYI